jgi:hypothetical protein
MRRFSLPLTMLVVLLLGVVSVIGFRTTAAQDATPAATAGHPLVGAWRLDTDVNDPTNPPSLAIFHSDGTYTELAVDGSGVGVWTSTGPTSGTLTAVEQSPSDQGGGSTSVMVRATIDVAADGQSLTATYTLEFDTDQAPMMPAGELGPGMATGTRIVAEPMGTPVSSLEDAFAAAFGSPPAGTPAP